MRDTCCSVGQKIATKLFSNQFLLSTKLRRIDLKRKRVYGQTFHWQLFVKCHCEQLGYGGLSFTTLLISSWHPVRAISSQWCAIPTAAATRYHLFLLYSSRPTVRFYPCDAMLARMLAMARCLSVCLSIVGFLSKRLDESSWGFVLVWELPSTYPTLC